MISRPRHLLLTATFAAAWLASGCISTGGTKAESASASAEQAKTTAAAVQSAKVGPGMNERGEVTDPRKVEAGYGQKVKGLNDWEGEITGKPAPGSKFTQLKIGMSAAQVLSLLGQPSDRAPTPRARPGSRSTSVLIVTAMKWSTRVRAACCLPAARALAGMPTHT